MANFPSLRGLIAATFTPLHKDGSLFLEAIPDTVEHLLRNGVAGMYVLGSTGEGVSMTYDERCRVAERFVEASGKRLPVIVQVGCESLHQARMLAAHAAQVGADAISAVSPVYFKPDSVKTLVASMAEIASGAPDLPFYYYHIPGITGINLNMVEFLKLGAEQIPNLRGIKFTSPSVHDYQACVEFGGDRFQILWGVDEMLLSGLTAGGLAAVGSTYNFAAPIYQKLLAAWETGDLDEARLQQSRSQEVVRTFVPYGPRASQKAIMAMIGVDCGPPRLPVTPLTDEATTQLQQDLTDIGFFEWIQ